MTRAGNPRLRAVEAFPVQHEGQRCIALRDPAGFTDQSWWMGIVRAQRNFWP